MEGMACTPRVIALVGPAGAGKTSLAEALLFASGAVPRAGTVSAGNCVGDASPEARARGGSTELNLMRLTYLDSPFVLLDTPGSPGFAADAIEALPAADLALVVIDPDPARAPLVEPVLRRLEAMGVPHALFVNKIDQARGRIADLLEALQPMSAAALVARQLPIREGGHVTGFVDLALERAYHYEQGKPSQQISLADSLRGEEEAARFHMLEQLADHDDALLEQLISDEAPSLETLFGDLCRETGEGVVVPVLFGSALNDFGIRRLLKMLRHDTPVAEATAARLGIEGPAVRVLKVSYGSTIGRLAIARAFGGRLNEGAELLRPDGQATRAGALFALQGATTTKVACAEAGDVVGIAKAEGLMAGEATGVGCPAGAQDEAARPPVANCALAIAAKDQKDEVRLSMALNRLAEEDAGLSWSHEEDSRETLLHAINDEHLAVTLDRLQRRYGVAVASHLPCVGYRESIRKRVSQRGRHKKQSGGHGQFGDVLIEIRPLERGEGFRFEDKISGGAIPKQWIPAVEQGVRDAMIAGPLGFPVVDVAVTLVDGAFHSVDSSELAFRTAGRIAMSEGLAAAAPYLLEPMSHVTIHTPGSATSKVGSTVASRRGQMLGLAAMTGWSRWDEIEALIPEAELQGLEAELRSLTQGMGQYEAHFERYADVSPKLTDEVLKRRHEMA